MMNIQTRNDYLLAKDEIYRYAPMNSLSFSGNGQVFKRLYLRMQQILVLSRHNDVPIQIFSKFVLELAQSKHVIVLRSSLDQMTTFG